MNNSGEDNDSHAWNQAGLQSPRFLNGVRFLRTLGVVVGIKVKIFYPTPKVQLNHFLHRTPKLGFLTQA